MANKPYQRAQACALSDYVPSSLFRTILSSQRSIPIGITEIPAEIHMSHDTARKLSFKIPWDGDIFGCLRGKGELQAALGTKGDILSMTLTDLDDRFLLLFDTTNNTDSVAFVVSQQEVIALLENCRRVPEQQS